MAHYRPAIRLSGSFGLTTPSQSTEGVRRYRDDAQPLQAAGRSLVHCRAWVAGESGGLMQRTARRDRRRHPGFDARHRDRGLAEPSLALKGRRRRCRGVVLLREQCLAKDARRAPKRCKLGRLESREWLAWLF